MQKQIKQCREHLCYRQAQGGGENGTMKATAVHEDTMVRLYVRNVVKLLRRWKAEAKPQGRTLVVQQKSSTTESTSSRSKLNHRDGHRKENKCYLEGGEEDIKHAAM